MKELEEFNKDMELIKQFPIKKMEVIWNPYDNWTIYRIDKQIKKMKNLSLHVLPLLPRISGWRTM